MKKSVFYKHPIISGLIVMGIVIAILYGVSGFAGMFGAIADATAAGVAIDKANLRAAIEPFLSQDLSQNVSNIAVIITALLALLIFCGLNRKNGYRGPFKIHGQNLKDVKIFVVIFLALEIISLPVFLFTYPGGVPEISLPLSMVILAIYAGINEEITDRGIPAAIMMRNKPTSHRIVAVALLTSVLFGVTHIVNLLAGQDLVTTLLQIVFAGGAGLFFAAIYLRTGSITICIIIHVLHDLLDFIIKAAPAVETSSFTINEVLTLCDNFAPIIFGILMLLPKYHPDIIETWTRIWPEKNTNK